MTAYKLVFHNSEDDERELGPFFQGVVFKSDDHTSPLSIYDVASDRPIARWWSFHDLWTIEGELDGLSHEVHSYTSVFVHAIDPSQPPIPEEARWR